jgi:hypothetical protein
MTGKKLGVASVCFNSDVHEMIFLDEAPILVSKLHELFEDKYIIKENHDKAIAFNELALAEQYRESLLIRTLRMVLI